MRKVSSAVAVGLLATALAGCASSTAPQSHTAAGEPGPAPASTSATDANTTVATTAPAAPATTATSTQTPASRTSASRPSPTTKPSQSPTTRPSTASSPGKPQSSAPSFGYNPAADSKAQIAAARAAAKADGREVLLDFGASWCGNCVAMDKSFHDAKVQAVLAASYHLVQVDVDASGSMGLLTQYAPSNSGGYGLPVLIILSPSGATRVDTDKSGNPGFDVSSFLAFLKKWAA